MAAKRMTTGRFLAALWDVGGHGAVAALTVFATMFLLASWLRGADEAPMPAKVPVTNASSAA